MTNRHFFFTHPYVYKAGRVSLIDSVHSPRRVLLTNQHIFSRNGFSMIDVSDTGTDSRESVVLLADQH